LLKSTLRIRYTVDTKLVLFRQLLGATPRQVEVNRSSCPQIGMTGNIIANKGFIGTYATATNAAGAKILDANVLAAWGGIQSAGQGFGMISMHL
jgi:hypothetical protein